MMKWWLCMLLVALAGACVDAPPVASLSQVPLQQVTVATQPGAVHRFQVEVARTRAEKQRGLMFRRTLPADHGMIFIYDVPQSLTFWMKDTPLPLDLVFINAAGRVVYIHERAVPWSEAPITTPVPVTMVLEVNAGLTRRLGIAVGDRVTVQGREQS
jgi:uncharacterized protein